MPDGQPASTEPIIPLLPYQRTDIESPARFNWCCWSRQIGKSFTKSLRRLLRGIQRRRNQIFLSAGERQSRELMIKVQQHCQALRIACAGGGWVEAPRGGCGRLELLAPNGIRIIGLAANPQTARGYTGDVLLDEFAMHRDDRGIWASIFPSVLRGDGELDVASTPKGVSNVFAELRGNPQFEHSIVTLQDAIAAGLDVDAETLRRSMGDDELFRQEFGCEFLDEATAFLTYEQIAGVEDPGLEGHYDLDALRAGVGPLYVGIDIGRHRDLTVFWVVEALPTADFPLPIETPHRGMRHERTPGQGGGSIHSDSPPGRLLITRGVRESQNEPFAEQMAAMRELLSLRRVRRCCIDASGIGMALAEAAVSEFGPGRVEEVTFTSAVKDELATRLRIRVEERSIRIPVDACLRNDWHSVRRCVTTAGPARYSAESAGMGHADRFWAACLAVRAAGGSEGVVEMVRGPRLRTAGSGIW